MSLWASFFEENAIAITTTWVNQAELLAWVCLDVRIPIQSKTPCSKTKLPRRKKKKKSANSIRNICLWHRRHIFVLRLARDICQDDTQKDDIFTIPPSTSKWTQTLSLRSFQICPIPKLGKITRSVKYCKQATGKRPSNNATLQLKNKFLLVLPLSFFYY